MVLLQVLYQQPGANVRWLGFQKVLYAVLRVLVQCTQASGMYVDYECFEYPTGSEVHQYTSIQFANPTTELVRCTSTVNNVT